MPATVEHALKRLILRITGKGANHRCKRKGGAFLQCRQFLLVHLFVDDDVVCQQEVAPAAEIGNGVDILCQFGQFIGIADEIRVLFAAVASGVCCCLCHKGSGRGKEKCCE